MCGPAPGAGPPTMRDGAQRPGPLSDSGQAVVCASGRIRSSCHCDTQHRPTKWASGYATDMWGQKRYGPTLSVSVWSGRRRCLLAWRWGGIAVVKSELKRVKIVKREREKEKKEKKKKREKDVFVE